MNGHTTHEQFIQAVRDEVIVDALRRGAISAEQAESLSHTKLLYGVGDGTYRGICHYDAWENGIGKVCVVEVAASAQESWTQLAGTVVHEMAHVLAGWGAAHGSEWKDQAVSLGFRIRPAAAGQVYWLSMFNPTLRRSIWAAAKRIDDGHPGFVRGMTGIMPGRPKPCSAGHGTKGGTSRGKGSGSRLRLWECECPKPVKVRIASDDFQATCGRCDRPFHRMES